MKICIVASCGGHLTEVRTLRTIYKRYDYFYVINDKVQLPRDMVGRTHFIVHSERDLKLIINFFEALLILNKEKPSLILSTGAGLIVPFAIVGKLLFGTKVIYIECITSIRTPSLSGRIMYWIADRFYYQWIGLKNYFPKGECIGPLI
jgi:beta-1,4-N-acetylglucosaminyltransferase